MNRRSGRRSRPIVLALSLAIVLAQALPAVADTVQSDADVVAGVQSSKNLGTVTPGQVIAVPVGFQLTCDGKAHADQGQSVPITYNPGASSAPAGGSISSATNASIGPIPASWADDTSGGGSTNCTSPAPVLAGTSSLVTLQAPTSSGAKTFTIAYSIGALTPGGNGDSQAVTGNVAPVTFTMTVVGDTTPPIVTPNVSGTLGSNGWYRSNVTVSWSVSDPDSTVTPGAGCGGATLTTDSTGTTYTCTATSQGGTTVGSVTVKRDVTNPTITATLTPPANAGGWNNGPVTISFTCDDATSGIDPAYGCPASQALSGSGLYTAHVATADRAGNVITPSFTVRIDDEGPSILGSATPAPNGNGWNDEEVTVHFECDDSRSGIASCTSDVLLSEGEDQSVTGTAVDNADNSTSTTVADIDVDLTDPGISFVGQDPAAISAGWNDSAVDLTWDCTDDLSGPEEASVTQTLANEGADQEATGTCTDLAGNQSSDTQTDIDIDLTDPEITFTGRTPANPNGWNAGDVVLTWSCSDALSGVVAATITQTVSAEGEDQSATATCEDLAGNTDSDTQTGISIDRTAPGIAFDHKSPAANLAGWNTTDVDLTWNCTDALSGAASATVTETITGQGAGLSATGTCTDLAGNTASDTHGGVKIDRTAPGITFAGQDPDANLNGWNDGTVTLSWSCTDDLSGAIDVIVTHDLTGEGDHQSATGTCEDEAGNTASSTDGDVRIDLTDPVITGMRNPAPNGNGWNDVPVDVSFTCTDDLSGVDVDTVAGAAVSSDGAGQSVTNTGECIDAAGNIAAPATVDDINVDATDPTITATLTPPANAGGWNNGPVTISFTCDDATSGIDPAYGCPASQALSGSGLYTAHVATADRAGNVITPSFTVRIDDEGPSILGSATPAPNGNGWNDEEVTVHFECDDSRSGIASCTSDVLLSEGEDQSVTGTAVDNADNSTSTTVADIDVDLTDPGISFVGQDPAAISAGWNDSAVDLTWDCTDDLSGPEEASVTQTLANEGADQEATGTCTDLAGNQSSDTQTDIDIDLTDPEITFTGRTPANPNGWNAGDVVLTWSCSDALSGVVAATITQTVSAEGEDQSATATCEDLAGNTDSDTQTGISIDRTAPGIAFDHKSPAANGAGWNTTDVDLTWNCTDALSGAVSVTVTETITGQGTNLSATGTCTDLAGNTKSDTHGGVKIDRTAPNQIVTGVASGATYVKGAVPAAGCSTNDALSGVATIATFHLSGGSPNGVGTYTATCSGAADVAGNGATTASVTYQVVYAGVGGILQPINPDNTSVFKRGQSVPVKFKLGGDEPNGFVTGSWTIQRQSVTCSAFDGNDATLETVPSNTPTTVFRYDASADQYIYNADMHDKNANTCWNFKVTLDSGQALYSAVFKLSK